MFYMAEEVSLILHEWSNVIAVAGHIIMATILILFTISKAFTWYARFHQKKVVMEEFDTIIGRRDAATFRYLLCRAKIPALIDGIPELAMTLVDRPLRRQLHDTLSKAIVIDAIQKQ